MASSDETAVERPTGAALLRRFAADEGAATAVEYAVLISMISLIVLAIGSLGGTMKEVFDGFALHF